MSHDDGDENFTNCHSALGYDSPTDFQRKHAPAAVHAPPPIPATLNDAISLP